MATSPWRREYAGSKHGLYAVWGDGQRGLWAAGGLGLFRRGADGTWSPCTFRGKPIYQQLCGGVGMTLAGADPKTFAVCTDGMNFRAKNVGARRPITAFNILRSGRVLVFLDGQNQLVYSDDQCKTFAEVSLNHLTSSYSSLGFKLPPVEHQNGTIRVISGNKSFTSTNDGLTWEPSHAVPNLCRDCVAYGDDLLLLESTTLLRMAPDGTSETVLEDEDTVLLAMIAHEGRPWIVVGARGAIFRSDDEGRTWSKEDSGASRDLKDVWDTGTGFCIVGQDDIILVSGKLNTSLPETAPPKKTMTKKGISKAKPQTVLHKPAAGDPAPVKPFTWGKTSQSPNGGGAVTSLAFHAAQLAVGDADGHVSWWRESKKQDWKKTGETQFKTPVSCLAFHDKSLWVGTEKRLVDVLNSSEISLDSPCLRLVARGENLIALCHDRVIWARPGEGVRAVTEIKPALNAEGMISQAITFSVDGVGKEFVAGHDGKLVMGRDDGSVKHISTRKVGTGAILPSGAVVSLSDKYELKWVSDKGAAVKTAFDGHSPRSAVIMGTDGASNALAVLDDDETLTLLKDQQTKAPLFRVGALSSIDNTSLGSAPCETDTTQSTFRKHKVISKRRVMTTTCIAQSGMRVAAANVTGEVSITDFSTHRRTLLGKTKSHLVQGAMSSRIYDGSIKAAACDENTIYAVAAAGEVVAVNREDGSAETLPLNLDTCGRIENMHVLNGLLLVRSAPDWIGFCLETGIETFRAQGPVDQMFAFGGALYGFERRGSYSARERVGHKCFRLDPVTGLFNEVETPTPPGSEDNAGWSHTMTAMQDGLLCRYFHAGDGSPLATLSTPGPKAVEVRDTSGKREAQYLWNPETGALASAPIFEPNIAPSPYLQGNGYLTTEDRAHVLTQQSDGMTRDWSLHSVTMAGSKTIASGRNDEGFDAAYVSVDHDFILFRHPLSTHMRATSLDGKLKCQWWTGGTMDEVLSSCDFKHLFRLGQTGIWRDRLA